MIAVIGSLALLAQPEGCSRTVQGIQTDIHVVGSPPCFVMCSVMWCRHCFCAYISAIHSLTIMNEVSGPCNVFLIRLPFCTMQHSQCMIHSASIQYILLYVFVMCYSDSEKCCSFTPKLVSLCFQDNYAFKIAFQESEICNSVLKLTV